MANVVYATEDYQSRPVDFDSFRVAKDIRRAAHYFWLSERRMPAAIVMSIEVAQAFTGSGGTLVGGELLNFGLMDLDGITSVPLLGRPGSIDPLWSFL